MTDRVLVAMSGGVDSSLAAALLKERGFSVEGVTMKLTSGLCCDIASAQAVCSHLGIPHRMVDLQQEFERSVVRNFIDEYRSGRTPNPCIRCNDILKFEKLLAFARENGFDHLATGHYARVDRDAASRVFVLRKGLDAAKDQSYFLYRLSQDQLRSVLFPLGGLRKEEVRRLAADRRLPSAKRPESQEICSVPDDDYRSFLREHAPDVLREGEIVLTDGTVAGRHEGIAFYTVGQRRGVGVAGGSRLYVVRIEPQHNRVVLGTKEDLHVSAITVGGLRPGPFASLAAPRRVEAKIRYRSPLSPALIEPVGPDQVRVRFDRPVSGVSPGQACVFYEGDTVLGGGVIKGE
jgi:tRNA-uridine 2-sulfurtransferase